MAPKDGDGNPFFRRSNSTIGLKDIQDDKEQQIVSADMWLDAKRADDGAEGLWRVHDKLYDLTAFVKNHPGGPEWLIMTKGTDITEAFEAHHIKGIAEGLLEKFYVRNAEEPRTSPFTFHDDGFYKTLKSRIREELPNIPWYAKYRTKVIVDILCLSYFAVTIYACQVQNYILGAIAGLLLTLTTNASHNFIHQKDNFRMYYLDLSMLSSREFRIVHALSHHLFPNTVNDLEITLFEPALQLFPRDKPVFSRRYAWIAILLLFPFLSLINYIFLVYSNLKKETFRLIYLIPFIPLVLMLVMTNQPFSNCFLMFIWTIIWSSIGFFNIAKTAAHHHPNIFHDGDTPRPKEDLDFGVHQLDAVGDRPNINVSLLLTLTTFGDHALHHLFPTLDHGILEYLYPRFLETCQEFGVEWKLFSSWEMVKGLFQQLARTAPNPHSPLPLKKPKKRNSKSN